MAKRNSNSLYSLGWDIIGFVTTVAPAFCVVLFLLISLAYFKLFAPLSATPQTARAVLNIGLASVTVTLVLSLAVIVGANWRALNWKLEEWTHRDIDGDGVAGKPMRYKTPKAREYGTTRDEQLLEFIERGLQDG